MREIFITSTTPKFSWKPQGKHPLQGLWMKAITIQGVLTTAGAPNYMTYKMKINGLNFIEQIKGQNDLFSGFYDIALLGSFSHHHVTPPLKISEELKDQIPTLEFDIVDQTGSAASLTGISIWLLTDG